MAVYGIKNKAVVPDPSGGFRVLLDDFSVKPVEFFAGCCFPDAVFLSPPHGVLYAVYRCKGDEHRYLMELIAILGFLGRCHAVVYRDDAGKKIVHGLYKSGFSRVWFDRRHDGFNAATLGFSAEDRDLMSLALQSAGLLYGKNVVASKVSYLPVIRALSGVRVKSAGELYSVDGSISLAISTIIAAWGMSESIRPR